MDPNNPGQVPPAQPAQPQQTPQVPASAQPNPPPTSPPPQSTPNQAEIASPQAPPPASPGVQVVTPKKGGGGGGVFKKILLVLILILLLVGGGFGALIFLTNQREKPEPIATEAPETETATESAEVEEGFQDVGITLPSEGQGEFYSNSTYGFSFNHPGDWEVNCSNCDEVPSSTTGWTILSLISPDYAVDEDGKITSGASFEIVTRFPGSGVETIEELVTNNPEYSFSKFNSIDGALSLNPGASFYNFVYDDPKSNFDISLVWRDVSQQDQASRDLQTILDSFKIN